MVINSCQICHAQSVASEYVKRMSVISIISVFARLLQSKYFDSNSSIFAGISKWILYKTFSRRKCWYFLSHTSHITQHFVFFGGQNSNFSHHQRYANTYFHSNFLFPGKNYADQSVIITIFRHFWLAIIPSKFPFPGEIRAYVAGFKIELVSKTNWTRA